MSDTIHSKRFVTWNINKGFNRDKIIKYLIDTNTHLLALQEPSLTFNRDNPYINFEKKHSGH